MTLAQTLGADALTLGRLLASKGRGKDSILAHINPREAAILKAHGGSGNTNPNTGLPEFDDTGAIPTEAVTVHAPAPQPTSIYIPTPTPQKQQVQAQAPKIAPVSAPAATAPENLNAGYAPAPAVPQPNQVQAPAIQPSNFGSFQTPYISQPEPAADTGGGVGDFLSSNKTALELGGLGALGIYGGMTNAKAAGQGAQLQQQLSSLAQPQQALGNAALTSTMGGNLGPAGERALQAAQAQTAQAQSGGAVSSQQASEAIATQFSSLLNTQLNEAISLLNNADQYLQQAYLQGYQANATTQQNTTSFYSGLAQLAVQMAGGGGTTINLPGATAQ